jgi:hypothetical protein
VETPWIPWDAKGSSSMYTPGGRRLGINDEVNDWASAKQDKPEASRHAELQATA